jgi:hypothetical protein
MWFSTAESGFKSIHSLWHDGGDRRLGVRSPIGVLLEFHDANGALLLVLRSRGEQLEHNDAGRG